MAETSPTSAPGAPLHFDVEQLASMAARIDKAAVCLVARLDRLEPAAEDENPGAPDEFIGFDAEKHDPLQEHYAQLSIQFNNVLREAKREVPEPFILSIPEASPELSLRLLPVYAGQLAERLRALSRLKASSYQRWQQFIDEVRLASRTANEAGSFVDRNREALKKLADR